MQWDARSTPISVPVSALKLQLLLEVPHD